MKLGELIVTLWRGTHANCPCHPAETGTNRFRAEAVSQARKAETASVLANAGGAGKSQPMFKVTPDRTHKTAPVSHGKEVGIR